MLILILTKIQQWTHNGFISSDVEFDSGLFDVSELEPNVKYVVPGFSDSHIHGISGFDTSDGIKDAVTGMAYELIKHGVSSFCPTTMTISKDKIFKCFEAVNEAAVELSQSSIPHAEILGIHLEGPFLNPDKCGVQDTKACMLPSEGFNLIKSLEEKFPNLLKIIDIAPELNGSEEFISEFKDKYFISAAHTSADYDTAFKAFGLGVKGVTHVLNAMNPFEKRAPGVLGAAIDYEKTYVEAICDGIHLHPSVLKMVFAVIADDKLVIVSDSMRGASMPDGKYLLGDTVVDVRGGRTYFGAKGDLAGSVTNMAEEVSVLKKCGIDAAKIVKAAAINPLLRIDMKPDTRCINLLDENFNLMATVFDGKIVSVN